MYKLVVGNIGFVGKHKDESEIRKLFNDYVEISKSGIGRAAGEMITIFNENGEIIEEYIPRGEENDEDF